MNFIRNGWYVAALSNQVGRDPIQRVMLGEPVVLYRTKGGKAVALSDRCPHRFAPLSMGKLKGDCIECPYHGLQFDQQGACTVNPHGDHKIPQAAKVRRYPVVERDGIVWTWMGAADRADASQAPDLAAFLGNGAMTLISGDFVVSAHYECVIDNLLDLSHAPFLHPTTLANPESIHSLRFEMKQEGSTVWAYHYAPATEPPPQFTPFRQSAERLCDFHAHMRWDAPANLQLDVGVTELGRPDAEGLFIHMAHLLTPIDLDHTRYTWIAARNFVPGNEEVSQAMKAQVLQAFTTEDEPMIHAVWQAMETPDLFALAPVLLPGDAASVRARRVLKQLREQEAQAAGA